MTTVIIQWIAWVFAFVFVSIIVYKWSNGVITKIVYTVFVLVMFFLVPFIWNNTKDSMVMDQYPDIVWVRTEDRDAVSAHIDENGRLVIIYDSEHAPRKIESIDAHGIVYQNGVLPIKYVTQIPCN